MSWLGWRALQATIAFVAALVLPATLLLIVTGLMKTGAAGVLAFGAWSAAMVLLVRVLKRRLLG